MKLVDTPDAFGAFATGLARLSSSVLPAGRIIPAAALLCILRQDDSLLAKNFADQDGKCMARPEGLSSTSLQIIHLGIRNGFARMRMPEVVPHLASAGAAGLSFESIITRS
jgi:hypothetical protein